MKRLLYRPESLILLISLGATLVLMGFLLTGLIVNRSETLHHAERDLRYTSVMLAEDAERSLGGMAILLQEVAEDLSSRRIDWPQWSEREGYAYLASRHTRALAQMRDIVVFDREGRQRFVSNRFPAQDVNVSDRPYFIALRNGADSAFSGPYVSRNSGRYTYALARRLTGPDKGFAGVVFAALEIGNFQQYCWPNRIHEDIDVFLINTAGQIVASCRPADLSAQSDVIGRHIAKKLGISEISIAPGHPRIAGRLFAISHLPGFPDLMVLATLPEKSALAAWNGNAIAFGFFSLLLIVILLSSGWLLHRQLRRLSATSAELQDHRQYLEERVRMATVELSAERDEAERANLAKSRFLAAASHDLRQPLHALSLFTSDLQRQVRSGLTRDLDELAGQINLSVLSLKEVFDSLLNISRLDMGKVEPEIHPFPLQEVFERMQLVFRRAAQTRRIVLRIHQTRHWLASDANLVERLISNLVSNAIRHNHQGGRVLLAARRRGQNIRIEIRDNGPGIASEDQELIFDEFFQVGNPERDPEKGLGLGLPIVRRLVRTLGGTLELRSQHGQGALFAITLPAAQPEKAVDPEFSRQISLILLANCPELARIAELAGAWGFRCQVKDTPEGAARIRSSMPCIVFARPEQGSQLRANLPADWPVVVVSEGRVIAGDGLHVLPSPIRPARLRALLEHLQKTLSKSIR